MTYLLLLLVIYPHKCFMYQIGLCHIHTALEENVSNCDFYTLMYSTTKFVLWLHLPVT